MTTTYKGFSTYNRINKFRLTDFALVKQDLFNSFQIRQGEKLMNPSFGTIIWNMIFEPFTPDVRQAIIKDIKRLASYDPRLAVNSVVVTEYEQGIQISLDLTYIPTNQTERMNLQFDQKTGLHAG